MNDTFGVDHTPLTMEVAWRNTGLVSASDVHAGSAVLDELKSDLEHDPLRVVCFVGSHADSHLRRRFLREWLRGPSASAASDAAVTAACGSSGSSGPACPSA